MAKRGNEIKDLKAKVDQMTLEREKQRLETKNSEATLKMRKEIKDEIEKELMENLDLDQYNITSDDLRSTHSKFTRGINMKGHILVPKLDLNTILQEQVRPKSSKKEDSSESEEEVDEDIQAENLKFMYEGSPMLSTQSIERKEELLN